MLSATPTTNNDNANLISAIKTERNALNTHFNSLNSLANFVKNQPAPVKKEVESNLGLTGGSYINLCLKVFIFDKVVNVNELLQSSSYFKKAKTRILVTALTDNGIDLEKDDYKTGMDDKVSTFAVESGLAAGKENLDQNDAQVQKDQELMAKDITTLNASLLSLALMMLSVIGLLLI